MKKLTIANIKSSDILSKEERKMVLGGEESGSGYGGTSICAATGAQTGSIDFCTNDPSRAMSRAGDTGWWCCNCAEAIAACGSKLD